MKRVSKLVFFSAALVMTPFTTANAGFEWVPPQKVQEAPTMLPGLMPEARPAQPVQAQPLDQDVPDAVRAIQSVSEGSMKSEQVKPEMAAQTMDHKDTQTHDHGAMVKTQTLEEGPVDVDTPDMAAHSEADHSATGHAEKTVELQSPTTSLPVVERDGLFTTLAGFGSDIPIAIAVKQIIPDGFSYSFDVDVDLTKPISWNGGEPWIEVLDGSLAEHGLIANLTDQSVRISKASGDFIQMPKPDMAVQDANLSDMADTRADDMTITNTVNTQAEPAMAEPIVLGTAPDSQAPVRTQDALTVKPQSHQDKDLYGEDHSHVHGHHKDTDHAAKTHDGHAHKNMDGPEVKAMPPARVDPIPLIRKAEIDHSANQNQSDHALENVGPGPAYDKVAKAKAPKANEPMALHHKQDEPMQVASAAQTPMPPVEDVQPVEASARPMPIGLPAHQVIDPSSPENFVKYDENKIHYWSAAQGADVKALLTIWSKKAGVTLYWGARSDYELKMPIELHGTYTQAIQSILETFGQQVPRPWGRFHPNLSDGKSILIVQNFPE